VLRDGESISPITITRPVTEHGLTKRLYAATRTEDVTEPFMAHFLRLARTRAGQAATCLTCRPAGRLACQTPWNPAPARV